MEPFTLSDGVVELVVPGEADIDAIHDACQDPAIQEWTTVPAPYSRADAEYFVREVAGPGWAEGAPHWAVREVRDGGSALVGMLSLTGAEPGGRAELGFWMAPGGRGRGLLARAVALALDTAFARGVAAVGWATEIHDGELNWDSWRAVWRHGFRLEGLARAALTNKGRLHDGLRATLLAGEPREPVAPWDGPARGAGTASGAAPSTAAAPTDLSSATAPTDLSTATAPTGPTSRAEPEDGTRVPASGGSEGRPATDLPDPRDPEALVRQFHATYDLPVITSGADSDIARVHMRTGLVVEEAAELVGAVYGERAEQILVEAFARAVAADDRTRDTVEVADALGDLVYVAYGMALECGIPLPAVLGEIQASNMSKLGADGLPIYREDGKVLKGPGFFPPDIAGVLDRERLAD